MFLAGAQRPLHPRLILSQREKPRLLPLHSHWEETPPGMLLPLGHHWEEPPLGLLHSYRQREVSLIPVHSYRQRVDLAAHWREAVARLSRLAVLWPLVPEMRRRTLRRRHRRTG